MSKGLLFRFIYNILAFVLPLEYNKWSVAAISAFLPWKHSATSVMKPILMANQF